MSRETQAQGDADVRRTLSAYFTGLVAITLLLGLLHVLFADFRVGGTRWFDLDRERNVSTWFSGLLFFLFGCSALMAWYWEQKRNAEHPGVFKLPILWLGVAAAGLYVSLDEITILHENLLWREVRLASDRRSDAWKYITQWQILFAPGILLGVAYFVVFFNNRFSASPRALKAAFCGIGCWVVALALEAFRATFQEAGAHWYAAEVVAEELLEMLGALFLLGAIGSYVLDIALDFGPERRSRLAQAAGWLNRRVATTLGIGIGALALIAGAAYIQAGRLAESGAPVPGLFRQALADQGSAAGLAGRAADGTLWFEDIAGVPPPAPALAEAAARHAAAGLFGGRTERSGDALLAADRHPRLAFLSTSDGRAQARVVHGSGAGLRAALDEALRAAGAEPGTDRVRWARVDVVSGVEPADRVSFMPPLEMERGIHGLTFNRDARIAFLPDELTGNDLVTEDLSVQPRRMLDYLAAQRPNQATVFQGLLRPRVPVPYRFFTTTAFFLDGKEIAPLFRGHRIFDSVTPASLLEAARSGGQYLIRAVRPDGSFDYSYLPDLDSSTDGYNMLRHAGTAYSMMELYEVTRDPALLEATERALRYLIDNIQPCLAGGQTYACPVDADSVKLGGNALAAIALVKHLEVTGDTRYREYLLPLCGWMLGVQGDDGEFTIHKQLTDGTIDPFVSAYYPGEAILALSRVYAVEQDPRLLRGASKAAHWLIGIRDRGLAIDDLNHDHWLLYALNDLYRQDPDPAFIEHARRITEAIVGAQNRQPDVPDWLGSYYKPPRSTPTAIRSEGLAASLALARDHGDPSRVPAIQEAIELGVRFQLQTQFGPETAMFLPAPTQALGGFRRGLTDNEIRIDYVQHNISALLALARLLETETEETEESN